MQSMGIFVIFILNRGNNNLRAALISQSNAFQLWVNNHNLEFSAGGFTEKYVDVHPDWREKMKFLDTNESQLKRGRCNRTPALQLASEMWVSSDLS